MLHCNRKITTFIVAKSTHANISSWTRRADRSASARAKPISRLAALCVRLALLASPACSGGTHVEGIVGTMRLALTSGDDTRSYRLREATFAIDGATPLELSSEASLDSPQLTQVLPVGDYRVTLLDGWHLERLEGQGTTEVEASLSSDNPVDFSIEPGLTTLINYRFQTTDALLVLGDGNLSLGIQVDEVSLERLVITEIMKDPSVLADTAGEWLEVYNPGANAMDLSGCTLVRDGTQTTIIGPLLVEPDAYATLARTLDPGFLPSYVLPGLSLPNTTSVSLGLSCAGFTLDQVVFDTASFPNQPGASLSLSADQLNTFANDAASSWCSGGSSYNGDFGTPGQVNPVCP